MPEKCAAFDFRDANVNEPKHEWEKSSFTTIAHDIIIRSA